MMISCLTYIQGFPVKIAILTNFAIASNLIKIHLKILSLNIVPINDTGSMWFKSWKTKIKSINLLSHVSNTGSCEPLVVILLSIKVINYISYLYW